MSKKQDLSNDSDIFNAEITELDKVRNTKHSGWAYAAALLVLLSSIIDMSLVPIFLIKNAVDQKLNNVDIYVWGVICMIYLFVNNLRLKAGAYIWGHQVSDSKVMSIVGETLANVGTKMVVKNSNSKK